MLRTEISKDEPLFPGDVIEMQFKVFGLDWVYFRAAELAALIWRLEKKNPDWELIAWDSTTHKDKLLLTFRILKSNPVVVTAAVIAVIVVGGGLFSWLCLDKVYRISRTPAGQVALAGSSLFVVGIVCLVAYFMWKSYPWSD
ncbi:hypothetical protein ES702_07369 [subsurface metagenome]